MLEQPVFGHFVPGYNLVNYFIAAGCSLPLPFCRGHRSRPLRPLAFPPNRLLTILFGSTWTGLVLVVLAGASFSLVPSIVWWASGLQQLMAIPAILATILCHVSYLSSGRIRFAVFGRDGFRRRAGLLSMVPWVLPFSSCC